MAALVSQNPNTGADEALNVTIDHPGGGAQPVVLNLRNVGQGKVTESKSLSVVTDDIGHGDEH